MLDQFRTILDTLLTTITRRQHTQHAARVTHHYRVEAYDRTGRLKWVEDFDNLVTTEGLNKYLDSTLKTGATSPTWYVGLVKGKTTGYAAGDTLASHGGWTEAVPGTDYTGNRQAWTPGSVAAGSVDNSASKASFPILTTQTMYGALLTANAAIANTTATLLGVGDFGTARSVLNGDTLQVTVTNSLTSS